VAFVLRDTFAVPFPEIARMLETTPAAARQLASRARRRVRGVATLEGPLEEERKIVDAFFAAARGGDFEALLNVLDPEVVLRADGRISRLVRGAAAVAGTALQFANAAALLHPVVVNGGARGRRHSRGPAVLADGVHRPRRPHRRDRRDHRPRARRETRSGAPADVSHAPTGSRLL
jgi:hypothetical protein